MPGCMHEVGEALGFRRKSVHGFVECRSHGGNAREVFGTASQAILLFSAKNDRRECESLFYIYKPDALRAVEFVRRGREEIEVCRTDVDGDVSDGLDGVGMEWNVVCVEHLGHVRDGLNGADFVVGRHDGDEFCLGRDGVLQMFDRDASVGIDGETGDPGTSLLGGMTCVEHGGMFYG